MVHEQGFGWIQKRNKLITYGLGFPFWISTFLKTNGLDVMPYNSLWKNLYFCENFLYNIPENPGNLIPYTPGMY